MNQPDELHADLPVADPLPPHTTPTWEVELLISGVAVFAMLQLPGLLDDAIFAWRPRFSQEWSSVVFLLYVYSKGAAVLLAGTFVIHLLLRARWIALVGLHSIYPGGIDWDRLRAGRIAREVESARMGSMDDMIERADNRATTVFATGVMLASTLVGLTLAVVVFGLVLLACNAAGFAFDPFILFPCMALLVLPFAVAQMADRRFGERLHPGSRAYRLVHGLMRGYSRVGMGATNNPVMAILASHGGQRRTILTTMATMSIVLVAVGAGYVAMRKPDAFGSFAMFPAIRSGDPGKVDAVHYDDQRNPARDQPAPYIQSMVVSGAYLRLTVPYEPVRDDPAMRRTCPQLSALAKTQQPATALACLQALHDIRLDGRKLAAYRYEVGSDPGTGRPALLAMIDVRDLARGRHELQVAKPPRADRPAGKPDREVPYSRIPFWR
ncbi:MAG: hypothetical protein ACMG5Z_08755 [Luteimonas sp.]